ncbi:DUF484 family protein [Neisseria sp. Ec49-e6-T10]|uniref:DUF484 family protein n=1 Tax=Neisseria sp. Ec49-e6-T10 TaxID=3140744 RepID=UPI003EBD68D2
MDKNAIVHYLSTHPDFLAECAERFGLQAKNNKVVSFSEVKLIAAEDKIQRLEKNIHTLIENAKHNEKLVEQLFALNLDLIKATSANELFCAISKTLNEYFNLEAYTIKLLPHVEKSSSWLTEEYYLPIGHPAIHKIEQLTHPICHHYLIKEMLDWLPTQTSLQSFIQIPIHLTTKEQIDGVMVIGSANPKRFSNEHDTIYVQKMVEAIVTTLMRLRNSIA